MRIAIVGAGAVGGYCAARLMQAGHEVCIVDIGAHLAAIQSDGLRVATPTEEWNVRPNASDDPTDIGVVDLVIFTVQSQDTAGVARGIQPLIGEQTIVVPLQNNVDNPEMLAAELGDNHVLAASIFIASSRPEPGLVRQLSDQVKINFAERDGRVTERVKELAKHFNEADLPCEVTTNIWKEIWAKFAFVIGFYLTAPLRSTGGEILDLDETRLLHWRLVNEVTSVAGAQGIEFGTPDLSEIIEATRQYGDYIPSSVHEIDEGRADEAVHMLRTIIHMGKEAGVPTPMAEATVAFTEFFNQRNKKRDRGN